VGIEGDMVLPKFVKIVEVGPRDGLQNETIIIPADVKIAFINLLSETGLPVIEATSFVSPKWIPQLADQKEVFVGIKKKPTISYPVLVPNLAGLKNAIAVGVQEIAVFTTPSEQFSQRNTNCSVQTSLNNISEIITVCQNHKIRVRAYISCVMGCPYQGDMQVRDVVELAIKLMAMGCDEISLGDTIGVGTPGKTQQLLKAIIQIIPPEKLAVHFHDTYGQALVNIYVALENGIHIIDSAVAGLGGCPYAKGASGNVATEEVVYMLNGLGIQTHVDLAKLIKAGRFINQYLDKPIQSKVNIAISNLQSD
jgi:hydroxymethylglutaryl-CoA lyase